MKDSLKRTLENEILEHIKSLDPNQAHVINVNARYGQYQIVVEPSKNGQKVDITGHIHHMYLTPDNISAYPPAKEVQDNLRHTVIVRDITIHMNYPDGADPLEINAAEYINLAGKEGNKILRNSKSKLSEVAEEIMEDDIVRALEGGEDSVTY